MAQMGPDINVKLCRDSVVAGGLRADGTERAFDFQLILDD